jgi:hypothetical protein
MKLCCYFPPWSAEQIIRQATAEHGSGLNPETSEWKEIYPIVREIREEMELEDTRL